MSDQIALTQGQVAIVDAADFDWLSQWRWHARREEGLKGFYAVRNDGKGIGRRQVSMHRLILGLECGDGIICDHINGNPLDNRRANLRIATTAGNNRNARKRSDNSSGFKGVGWDKKARKWRAGIRINGKRKALGRFSDPVAAHLAYCSAAQQLHGEFARFA